MIAAFALGFLAWPFALPASAPAPSIHTTAADQIDEKIAAAGKDVARLLELAAASAISGQADDARKVYARVLEIDKDNRAAHEGLGHQLYAGKWFESFAALASYKRTEAAEMKRKGLAAWKDGWVPAGDVPFLQMGWTKEANGSWTNPLDAARAKQVEEWQAAGYQLRADDDSWVAPEDFDKWQALLWKCGDEWLDTAAANEYHAAIEHPWELAGEHFVVLSTCDWDVANLARWHAEQARPELVRLFSIEPAKPVSFFVLNSLAQYNQAAGNQGTLVESEGLSSVHGAYFANCTFDFTAVPPQHVACGVSYWDKSDATMAAWGPFWARWAAAQSFIDAIDPSWVTVGAWIAKQGNDDIEAFKGPFWGEKKIPRWLRYGAASYVERYMRNPEAAEGADPWDLRSFAFAELKRAGGMGRLADLFAFDPDSADIARSNRLYQEAGLVVAYLLDGAANDKGLREAHQAFVEALSSGTPTEAAAASLALQKTLAKHERDIRKFAGL